MTYNIYERLEEMQKQFVGMQERIEKQAKQLKELNTIVQARIGDVAPKMVNHDDDAAGYKRSLESE